MRWTSNGTSIQARPGDRAAVLARRSAEDASDGLTTVLWDPHLLHLAWTYRPARRATVGASASAKPAPKTK